MGNLMAIAGVCLIIFGIADYGLYAAGVMDLTGVSWSPIAAGILGTVLLRVGGD